MLNTARDALRADCELDREQREAAEEGLAMVGRGGTHCAAMLPARSPASSHLLLVLVLWLPLLPAAAFP